VKRVCLYGNIPKCGIRSTVAYSFAFLLLKFRGLTKKKIPTFIGSAMILKENSSRFFEEIFLNKQPYKLFLQNNYESIENPYYWHCSYCTVTALLRFKLNYSFFLADSYGITARKTNVVHLGNRD